MSGMFSKPKVQKVKPQKVSSAAVQDESEAQRTEADEERRRRRASLASNILFGSGNQGPGPTIATKTALGQ